MLTLFKAWRLLYQTFTFFTSALVIYFVGFGLWGLKNSRVQGFKGSNVQGFKGSNVKGIGVCGVLVLFG
jgi:hypothetical protein